jgi:hypothetical protein
MNTAVNSTGDGWRYSNPWVAAHAPVIQGDAIHVARTLGEKRWYRVRQWDRGLCKQVDLVAESPDLDAVLAGLKSQMDNGTMKPAQIILYIGGEVIEVTPEMLEVLSQ